jgi:hypothetical protein
VPIIPDTTANRHELLCCGPCFRRRRSAGTIRSVPASKEERFAQQKMSPFLQNWSRKVKWLLQKELPLALRYSLQLARPIAEARGDALIGCYGMQNVKISDGFAWDCPNLLKCRWLCTYVTSLVGRQEFRRNPLQTPCWAKKDTAHPNLLISIRYRQ